jgi:polygalacturonase
MARRWLCGLVCVLLVGGAPVGHAQSACEIVEAAQLQAVLTRCAGQHVRLAPGRYPSGPLFLASGTTFELAAGATLVATDEPDAYARPDGGLYALVNAADASQITLTGSGTIDGNGASWWERTRAAQRAGQTPPNRPRLVALDRCSHVRVEGIRLEDSPSFHLVFRSCTDVLVDGVTITAPADSPNTDGIDPMSSHDVRITGSTIDSGDDNIAVKSGLDDPAYPGAGSSDISVDNCTFLHGHGVSIGSETNGGVQSVTVSHSTFRDTQNGARIKTNRQVGGPISHIVYSNLSMQGVQQPIAFASYYPSIPAVDAERQEPVSPTTPQVSDVLVSNVEATDAQRAGWIVGLPEAPLQAVTLANVAIAARGGLQVRNAAVTFARTRIDVQQGPDVLTEGSGLLLRGAPVQVP